MNAKEMFEELGYTKIRATPSIIRYRGKHYYITIWVEEKRYDKANYESQDSFTVEEHKAIHQQMKELGWIDE